MSQNNVFLLFKKRFFSNIIELLSYFPSKSVLLCRSRLIAAIKIFDPKSISDSNLNFDMFTHVFVTFVTLAQTSRVPRNPHSRRCIFLPSHLRSDKIFVTRLQRSGFNILLSHKMVLVTTRSQFWSKLVIFCNFGHNWLFWKFLLQ